MSVEFITREYEFNHGHRPRGKGTWAFYFSHGDYQRGTAAAWWAEGTVTYTEAKKQATAEARRRKVTRAWVAP